MSLPIEYQQSTQRMNAIVKHNQTVYLCGQVAHSSEWDIVEQTKRCLAQIEQLLVDAGSSREHMLSVTIYLRDMKDFEAMNAVWDKWVSDIEKPARACVEARMATPAILVEFSVVAAL